MATSSMMCVLFTSTGVRVLNSYNYLNAKILLLKWLKSQTLFLCLGKLADLYDETHRDCAPTKNMRHSSSSVSKPISQSALPRKKPAKERQSKKRKCVQESCKEIAYEGKMNIIGEGDSEKGNIDVKTSARKETSSLEYASIAIQADPPKQDIEGQENIKPSKPGCKFGPIN